MRDSNTYVVLILTHRFVTHFTSISTSFYVGLHSTILPSFFYNSSVSISIYLSTPINIFLLKIPFILVLILNWPPIGTYIKVKYYFSILIILNRLTLFYSTSPITLYQIVYITYNTYWLYSQK